MNCKEIIKQLNKYILLTIILMIVFIFALLMTRLIPQTSVQKNILESINIIESEGVFPNYTSNEKEYLGQDNFTDSLMLNIVYNLQDNDYLKSIMKMKYTKPEGDFDGINGLTNIESNKEEIIYARYWHGYISYLKPLLSKFNYNEIRQVNRVILSTLVLLSIIMIYKRLDIRAVCIFILGIIAIDINRVWLSVQYMGIFMIALISLIIVLRIDIDKYKNLHYIFFIVGGVTSFVDLLTAPIITLGLPLIFIAINIVINLKFNVKEIIKLILQICIAWAMGYIIIWSAKWAIATLILQINVLKDAVASSQYRLSGLPDGFTKVGLLKYSISQNVFYLLHENKKFIVLGFVINMYVLLLKFNNKKICIKQLCLFGILATIPYIWYIVLMNHSAIHAFFTYRSQIIMILCICTIPIYGVDWSRIVKKY